MATIKAVKEIPLKDLVIGKGQVRLRDVNKDVTELADSIRKIGLLEPIVVCPADKPGKYEIITGQRRFLAHQELKKETILAAVLDEKVDETTAKVLSISENLVRRDLNRRDLIDACRAAMRGESFLYPNAVTALVREYLEQARRGEAAPEDPLTPRELQVVKLIAEGHTSDEIAHTLVISRKTVDHHRARILDKLGMRNGAELTRYAIRRGLVEP